MDMRDVILNQPEQIIRSLEVNKNVKAEESLIALFLAVSAAPATQAIYSTPSAYQKYRCMSIATMTYPSITSPTSASKTLSSS